MAIEVRRWKNGASGFRARVKDPEGRWYPSTCFDKREDALEEEAKLLRKRRKGTLTTSQDAKTITVSEYWEVWSVENRAEVSAGWRISQDQMFRDYIGPVIGSKKLAQVKKPEVLRVLNTMRKMGRGAQTVMHVYSLMNSMFRDAVDFYEMLAESPVSAAHHRPSVIERKRPFLLPEQALVFCDLVKETYLGPPVWLQVLSALRVSEVQGLPWRNVHWELGQFLIDQIYNNKTDQLQPYPKGKEADYVPMPPMLRVYLARIYERERPRPTDFVCQGPNGGMLSYETYCRALPRELVRQGYPRLTTHELRHSSTEIWFQAGASQEDIRRLLNHSSKSGSATARYIHRTGDRLQALGGNLGKGLVLVMGGKGTQDGNYPQSYPHGEKEAVCLSPEGEVSINK